MSSVSWQCFEYLEPILEESKYTHAQALTKREIQSMD